MRHLRPAFLIILLVPVVSGCCLPEAIGAIVGEAISLGFRDSDAIDIDIPSLRFANGCPQVIERSASIEQFKLIIDGATIEAVQSPDGAMDFVMFGAFRVPPEEFQREWISSMNPPMRYFFEAMATDTDGGQNVATATTRPTVPIKSFHPPGFYDMYFCLAHFDILLKFAHRADDPAIADQARALYVRIRNQPAIPFDATIPPHFRYSGIFTLLPQTKRTLDEIFGVP